MRYSRFAPCALLILASCGSREHGALEGDTVTPVPQAPAADVRVDGVIGPDGMFNYPPGNFFIRFPGMPVHDQSITRTGSGELVTEMFVYEAADPIAYMVAYSMHDLTMILEEGETVLDVAMRGALGPLGIEEPRSVEQVTLNGNRGLRFQGDNGELFMDSQVQILNDQLFRVTVLAKGAYAPRDAVEQFIGSFHYAPVEPQEWQDVFEGGQ